MALRHALRAATRSAPAASLRLAVVRTVPATTCAVRSLAASPTHAGRAASSRSFHVSSAIASSDVRKEQAPKGGEEPTSTAAPESEPASAEQTAQTAARAGALYSLTEGIKDVLSVTFGWERKRNVAKEYDMGVRAYPWQEYTDPITEQLTYRNVDTNVITLVKPLDFDARATNANRVSTNVEASGLTVVKHKATTWEKTLDAVTNSPVITGLMAVGNVVAASPVGQGVKKIGEKVSDKVEDLRETWETSQHPLVVNAAYAVDSLTAETEQGRALNEIQQLDAGFDQYAFIDEMSNEVLPQVVKAFFALDMPILRKWCKDSALAQIKAVAAAREAAGLKMDGTVLNVHKVELAHARTLERGVPIVLVTSQVQYIHCVKNTKGEIVEGGESEIRAAFFLVAVTREYDDAEGKLVWRIVELSMQGSMLYL